MKWSPFIAEMLTQPGIHYLSVGIQKKTKELCTLWSCKWSPTGMLHHYTAVEDAFERKTGKQQIFIIIH